MGFLIVVFGWVVFFLVVCLFWFGFFPPPGSIVEKNLSQAYSFLNLSCSSSLVKMINMKPCSPIYSLAKPVCSMSVSGAVSPSGWGWLSFVLSSTEILGRTLSHRIKQQGQTFITSKERTLISYAVSEFCFHVKNMGPGSWLEFSPKTSWWSAPPENLSGILRWCRSWGITNLPFSLYISRK